MQLQNGQLLHSASDVVGFLECPHLTALNLQSLGDAQLRAQKVPDDASAELVARKGIEHESAYLQHLRDEGRMVVDIAEDGGSIDDRVARTVAAMAGGADVVFQATLRDSKRFGHADFLLRTDDVSSKFGTWSYEVADTKLARTPKAKFLVQLAFYSQLLGVAQGIAPVHMRLVLGDQTQPLYRCADYRHYVDAALVRYSQHVDALSGGAMAPYPEPCAHCDLCPWRDRCQARRVMDDHLCQVANISRVQWTKLQAFGIDTMAALAALPADAQVPKIHPDTLERVRSQALLQHRARQTGQREVLVLPPDPDARRGFFRLPQPDEGDLFFDMEGNPLEDGGLEYLFGFWLRNGSQWTFQPFWGLDRAGERLAIEQCIDFIVERRRTHPGAHVYHYASYEETALKRLAGQHATREVALDKLLRAGVLVDLYKVVREGIRISEPSYSIKYVEHFYRPARAGDVQNAGASIVAFELWRETQEPQLLQDIADYNRDDVQSTQQLRDWLLEWRPKHMPWKPPGTVVGVSSADAGAIAGAEAGAVSTDQPTATQLIEQRLAQYRIQMIDPLPQDPAIWSLPQQALELTWQLLDFHRRTEKPQWWAQFARMDLQPAELIDDAECLGGLEQDLARPPYPDKRSTVYTYRVPPQETKLYDGASCTRCDNGQPLGALQFDEATWTAQLRLGPGKPELPARMSIGPSGPINSKALVNAIYRFADSLLAGNQRYPALERLLHREPPQLLGRSAGQPLVAAGSDLLQASLDTVSALDESHLYVQGPPGSGKTYTGARMIASLLAQGRRVGIMSNSHKAIHNLLTSPKLKRLFGELREVMRVS